MDALALSQSKIAEHPAFDRPGKLSRSTRASFALASSGWAGEFEGRGFGAPLKARDRLASRWIPDARKSIGREGQRRSNAAILSPMSQRALLSLMS